MDPIGQSASAIPAEGRDGHRPAATIVGVVADSVLSPLRSQLNGTLFLPIERTRSNLPSLVIRTASPALVAMAVEDALRRVDARIQPTTSIVQERVDVFLGRKRMLALLAGPTAALALILAALGVYGVTTFVVSHRTREVSVRMALGASTGAVLRLLIKDSLRPVVIGLVVGLVLALGVGRVFASELAGISPHDPLAIGLSTLTLLAVAFVAVVVPARRVAKTDPASALRQS